MNTDCLEFAMTNGERKKNLNAIPGILYFAGIISISLSIVLSFQLNIEWLPKFIPGWPYTLISIFPLAALIIFFKLKCSRDTFFQNQWFSWVDHNLQNRRVVGFLAFFSILGYIACVMFLLSLFENSGVDNQFYYRFFRALPVVLFAWFCSITCLSLLITFFFESKNEASKKKFHLLFAILDLGIAFFILLLINGQSFINSDATNLLALTKKVGNPSLYPTDIAFSASPLGYSFFFTQYLYFFSKIIPIDRVMVFSNIASQLILLIALRRLFKSVVNLELPAIAISLFLLGLGGNDLIVGYHLISENYSSHYSAIALSLLGISFFLTNKKIPGALLLILAILFNLRMGFLAFGFFILFLIWKITPPIRKKLIIGLGSVFIFFMIVIIWQGVKNPNSKLSEIINIWVFFRSSPHYMPFLYPYKILNFFMISIFIGSMMKKIDHKDFKAWFFATFCCIFGIILNILNNATLLNPIIVLAQFWEISFIVVVTFYLFAGRFLFDRVKRGFLVSSIIILLSTDFQTRVILLLTCMILDPLIERITNRKKGLRELISIAVLFIVFSVEKLWIPQRFLQQPLPTIPISWFISFGITLLVLMIFHAYSYKVLVYSISIGLVFTCLLIGQFSGLKYSSLSSNSEWKEVTDYASDNTALDAVFIINPQIDNFQALSERSAFVTFKHIPAYTIQLVPEWFSRMQLLKVVPKIEPITINQQIQPQWDQYDLLTKNDINNIKEKYNEVDYVVMKRTADLDFPIVFENHSYRVYQIPE